MNLREWAVHHIKQIDMVKKNLVSYKEEDDRVLCEYRESKATYYCAENLALEKLKSVKEGEVAYFVCMCNEHNFKMLADHWDLFKAKPGLTFIFLNPELAEKWIIKPYVHAKVADPKTLRQGLRTMYDTCMGTSRD
ncbi:MAG TPA: hypothetical protein VJ461_03435 [Candidatus Nanoarchaeia archaeon]|nr:hypothetical protein [Candidatus Nanoarchaeia archaeon]